MTGVQTCALPISKYFEKIACKGLAISKKVWYSSNVVKITTWKREYLGVAQLVARYLGVVEAVGSSPVTQTKMEHSLFTQA